jgi:hypothetical protein
MVIDVIAPADSLGPIVAARKPRVLRLPTDGFGSTSEAVVVVAVAEETGTRLASAESGGFGVIIRPTLRPQEAKEQHVFTGLKDSPTGGVSSISRSPS